MFSVVDSVRYVKWGAFPGSEGGLLGPSVGDTEEGSDVREQALFVRRDHITI